MPSYFLPQWIYMCLTADGAVFLDVRHDRYSGLNPARTQTLSSLLAGDCERADCQSLAAELISAGLLTLQSDNRARPLAATLFAPPESVLVEPDDEVPAINALHVVRFLSACISVWVRLRIRSLEYALSQLQTCRARATSSGRGRHDINTAKQLASIFVYLRAFAYTASDHCLYDSLVLSDFLRRYRVSSTCVFGVRTLPFAAHCWVQSGTSLTTEVNLEYVAAFSPICAI